MVIDIHWYDAECTMIYHKLVPPWSWEDYFQFVHTANDMMDTVPHIVHIITDAREIHQIPPHLFFSLQRMVPHVHPRSGSIIILHNNRLFNMVYGVLKRTAHPLAEKYILAPTLEKALEQLHSLERI